MKVYIFFWPVSTFTLPLHIQRSDNKNTAKTDENPFLVGIFCFWSRRML